MNTQEAGQGCRQELPPELTEGRPVYHLQVGGIDWTRFRWLTRPPLKGPVRAWTHGEPAPNEGIQQMPECYKTGKAEYIDRETPPLVEDTSPSSLSPRNFKKIRGN